jgi:hypothetical protein
MVERICRKVATLSSVACKRNLRSATSLLSSKTRSNRMPSLSLKLSLSGVGRLVEMQSFGCSESPRFTSPGTRRSREGHGHKELHPGVWRTARRRRRTARDGGHGARELRLPRRHGG